MSTTAPAPVISPAVSAPIITHTTATANDAATQIDGVIAQSVNVSTEATTA